MHAWEEVQKTIDYIEEHIKEEITIKELAELASLSQFYYQRLFHRLVKQPVAEYIKLRRMAKAKDAILETDKRLVDIALDFGFVSHEHFSRTFKNTFGMSPSQYRKEPSALNCMTKPELLLNYVLIDEGVPLITDQIVLEIGRRIVTNPVTYMGYERELPIEYGQGLGLESGVDPLDLLWNTFHEQKKINGLFEEASEEVGVVLPGKTNGFYRYFVGARAVSSDPTGKFKLWHLQEGEYVVCYFEAENFEALVMDALYKAQKYLTSIWIPKHNLEMEPFLCEYYASHTPDTSKMEIWVKIK